MLNNALSPRWNRHHKRARFPLKPTTDEPNVLDGGLKNSRRYTVDLVVNGQTVWTTPHSRLDRPFRFVSFIELSVKIARVLFILFLAAVSFYTVYVLVLTPTGKLYPVPNSWPCYYVITW